MMKVFGYRNRWVCSLVIVLTVLALTAMAQASEWSDGVYTGTGRGYNGPIRVEVIVEDGKLLSITVIDHSETPFVGDAGFAVVDEMIATQSIEVTAVTGATATSRGIIEAVTDSLSKTSKWVDGVFRGEGKGYNGMITVEVEIAHGEIAAIEVISHSETPFISDAAFRDVVESIVNEQELDVDIVTGATLTSKGIIDAVKSALDIP